jgi:hypothetical protein
VVRLVQTVLLSCTDTNTVSKQTETALSKEGEDDEPMAHQNIPIENSCVVSNIAAGNCLISSGLQFGTIYFDEKYGKNMKKFTSAGLSSNIIFIGATLLKRDVLI